MAKERCTSISNIPPRYLYNLRCYFKAVHELRNMLFGTGLAFELRRIDYAFVLKANLGAGFKIILRPRFIASRPVRKEDVPPWMFKRMKKTFKVFVSAAVLEPKVYWALKRRGVVVCIVGAAFKSKDWNIKLLRRKAYDRFSSHNCRFGRCFRPPLITCIRSIFRELLSRVVAYLQNWILELYSLYGSIIARLSFARALILLHRMQQHTLDKPPP